MSTAKPVSSRPASAADPSPPRAGPRAIEGDTASERRAFGEQVRDQVPLRVHAEWRPPADRPDPVALLIEQDSTRVEELVPIRYGRMLQDPFAFYRGGALIMAADLARLPSTGIYVQASGDAHLSNFGVFATPERRLIFDVNDFDETYRAPFEWDLKRLAASVVIAGRQAGLKRSVVQAMARAVGESYRTRMATMADMTFLDAWYTSIDITALLARVQEAGSRKQQRRARRFVRSASANTPLGDLRKLAVQTEAGWRLREKPPLLVRYDSTPERKEGVNKLLAAYRRSLAPHLRPLVEAYRFVDFGRKVVGVGSVGMESFVLLGIGWRSDDALFLQLKEATGSVLEGYTKPGLFRRNGQRVVEGQRLMQAASDQFLGWTEIKTPTRTSEFYVRQLHDWKASFDVDAASEKDLGLYARACAQALARAHARSGSASAITGYLGRKDTFDRALEAFAVAYADQNERDFHALGRAAGDGRITVRPDE